MLHSGLGEKQLSTFLASLEIPSLNPRTLKEREKEISPLIKQYAKESCNRVLCQEKEL